jgi:hypothetical protein
LPELIKFFKTDRFKKAVKKSKHNIERELETIKQILGLNPDYGASIPHFGILRKMRVRSKASNFGKSGGYRLIYRKIVIDEIVHIIFLDLYFKGDKEDLSQAEYKNIETESEEIIKDPNTDWEWH